MTSQAAPQGAGLSYLSAAIGALAKDNVSASKLLIQLCTQVTTNTYTSFTSAKTIWLEAGGEIFATKS